MILNFEMEVISQEKKRQVKKEKRNKHFQFEE